jgi:hypothetical protein
METQQLTPAYFSDKKEYIRIKTVMTPKEKEILTKQHIDLFNNKRDSAFKYGTFKYNNPRSEEFVNIRDLACEYLTTYGITDFDKDKYTVEFHQKSCFGKSKKSPLAAFWHTDINTVSPFIEPYTVLFYIRRDKTIKGGNFKCMPSKRIFNFNTEIIDINEGDVLIFDGSMSHLAMSSHGFGCRDVIAVFINPV